MQQQVELCKELSDSDLLPKFIRNLLAQANNEGEYSRIEIPKRRTSLTSTKGEFYLYRLTGSQVYSSFRESMFFIKSHIEDVKDHMFEKMTIFWLDSIFNWVEKLSKAVQVFTESNKWGLSQLTLSRNHADSLIQSGSTVFLNVSKDVKNILFKYQIKFITNKLRQKVSVTILKGGFQRSVGGLFLQWAVFCFDALKGDLLMTQQWENDAIKILDSISYDKKKRSTESEIANKDALHLIRTAKRDLMIVPENSILMKIFSMKKDRQKILKMKGKCQKGEEDGWRYTYVTRKRKCRFFDEHDVVSDRFLLLDSLLSRKKKFAQFKSCSNLEHQPPMNECKKSPEKILHLREKSRERFESIFLQSFEPICIKERINTFGDIESFCSLTAWKLEYLIFEKYHGDEIHLKNELSNDYDAKVCTLQKIFSDGKNRNLCLSIVIGKTPMSELIDMSSEDLTHKELEREKAKPRRKDYNSASFGGGHDKFINDVVDLKSEPVEVYSSSLRSETSILQCKKKNSIQEGISSTQKQEITPDNYANDLNTNLSNASSIVEKPQCNKSSSSFTKGEELQGDQSAQHLQSFHNEIDAASHKSKCLNLKMPNLVSKTSLKTISTRSNYSGHSIISFRGTARFKININALKLSFSGGLFLDSSWKFPTHLINNLIPDSINDKGRLPIEEFNKFISTKLHSNRWIIAPLRLVNIKDGADSASYKKYYKEYEAIRRIAMFSVPNRDMTIFLVSPKFLHLAKCLHSSDFQINKSCTYAVVLTRKKT